MKCPITHNECDTLPELKITRADRFLGTNRVMVYGPNDAQLRFLHGRFYQEVRYLVLELSDDKTRFYRHIQSKDPNQPVRHVEVTKNEW